MASPNERKKEHFSMLDDIKEKLGNPLVIGGILVIIILIVVAVIMWQKQKSGAAAVTDTASNIKYLLSNTPELAGYN